MAAYRVSFVLQGDDIQPVNLKLDPQTGVYVPNNGFLARGGYAEVYKCYLPVGDRLQLCAGKAIDLTKACRDQVQDEYEMLASVWSIPGVVKCSSEPVFLDNCGYLFTECVCIRLYANTPPVRSWGPSTRAD